MKRKLYNLLWVFLLSFTTSFAQEYATTSTVIVSNDDDTNEYSGDNGMWAGSSAVDLANTGKPVFAGLRFTDVQVPQNAAIVDAYIEFTVKEVSTGDIKLIVQGLDDANVTLPNENFGLTNFTKTSSKISWEPSPWETIDEKKQTSNIASIIQEIVNKAEWTSGNALGVVIFEEDTTGSSALEAGQQTRNRRAYSGNTPAKAPRLVIKYGQKITTTATVGDSEWDGISHYSGDNATWEGSDKIVLGFKDGNELSYGLRIRELGIPQGTAIVDAKLNLTAFPVEEGAGSGALTVEIRGEKVDSAANFSDIEEQYEGADEGAAFLARPRTENRVLWTPEDWVGSEMYSSPNLAGILQEVINRPGWDIDNAVAFYFTTYDTTGNYRIAYSGTHWDATRRAEQPKPVLEITYAGSADVEKVPPTQPATTVVIDVFEDFAEVIWSPSTDEDSGLAGYQLLDEQNNVIATVVDTFYVFRDLTPNTTYNYGVRAVDKVGNVSEITTIEITTIPEDNNAPVMTSVTAVPSAFSVDLSWVEATDNEDQVANYNIYAADTLVSDQTENTFFLGGLEAESSYTLEVSAVDRAGNESDRNQVNFTTTAPSLKDTINDSNVGDGLNQFQFFGNWRSYSAENNPSYGNDEHYTSDDPAAYFEIRFFGNMIEVYGVSASHHTAEGKVYLDGELIETFNSQTVEKQTQKLLYRSEPLSWGEHVLRVENGGDLRDPSDPQSRPTVLVADFAVVLANYVLSFEELSNQNILSLYPNPVTDNLNIELQGEQFRSEVTLTLTNLEGKMLHRENFMPSEKKVLNLTTLPKGLYILNLQGSGLNIRKKIIK